MRLFNKKTKTVSSEDQELFKAEKIYQQGVAKIQDLIAPSAFKVTPYYTQVGTKYARTLFVFTYPRFLQTGWLGALINIDKTLDISMFIYPMDSAVILKNLQKAVARLQSQVSMDQEKGKVRDPVLETAFNDAEALRDKLQQGTERFFRFGLYITVYADSIEELDDLTSEVSGLLETHLVYTKVASFQQAEAFNSTVPILKDELQISNNMNSAPLSTTFPFISADVTSNKGVLYGINRHNNSLILFDRFSMENANEVIFAKSGSGKSYLAKLEILRSLMMGTTVLVIDPEKEYSYLCETVGGTFLHISLGSNNHINPFDLPLLGQDDSPDDILRSNIGELTGMLKLMLGHLTAEEESILDRALYEVYAAKDITPDSDFTGKTPPLLHDLEKILREMEGGRDMAIRLEKYTTGSFSGFIDKPTNVKLEKEMVVFNIRDMEEELRPLAMYIILHYIWKEIRRELKKRILVVDEAWLMMQHEDAAAFMLNVAKRARKYYLGLTTITQDIADFLGSKYGKPIVTNSSIQILLKQSPASVDLIAETFYLTEEEKFLLLESGVGEGIFFAGLKHAAIKIVASYSEDQVITSNPEQLLEIEKAKKELEGQRENENDQ